MYERVSGCDIAREVKFNKRQWASGSTVKEMAPQSNWRLRGNKEVQEGQ